MIRKCDGTDPNLTRNVPAADFSPDTMTLSHWDGIEADPAQHRVINCDCGLPFDDTEHRVIYPHDPIPTGTSSGTAG